MKPGDKRRAVLEETFRRTRYRQVAGLVPAGGAWVLLADARTYAVDIGLGPIVLAAVFLLAVSAVFSWVNWRCPACRRHIGLRWKPDPCAGCGFALRSR